MKLINKLKMKKRKYFGLFEKRFEEEITKQINNFACQRDQLSDLIKIHIQKEKQFNYFTEDIIEKNKILLITNNYLKISNEQNNEKIKEQDNIIQELMKQTKENSLNIESLKKESIKKDIVTDIKQLFSKLEQKNKISNENQKITHDMQLKFLKEKISEKDNEIKNLNKNIQNITDQVKNIEKEKNENNDFIVKVKKQVKNSGTSNFKYSIKK